MAGLYCLRWCLGLADGRVVLWQADDSENLFEGQGGADAMPGDLPKQAKNGGTKGITGEQIGE